MRSKAVPIALVVGLSAFAAPAAEADQLQVEIHKARPGKQIEVSVRSPQASGATSGRADAAGSLSALLEVANLGKAKPAEARVQIAQCTDRPDRLTVVGQGAEAARCEDGHTPDGCSCHEIGAILLGAGLQKIGVDWEGRALVQGAARDAEQAFGRGLEPFALGLRVGTGAELNVFKREACSGIEGFTATCDLDRSGVAPLFLVELLFMPWLAAGVAFEPIEGVRLERDLLSLDTPGLTGTLRDGHFDPRMVKLYMQPEVALADQLGLFGQIGIGRWWARSGRTVTLAYAGQSRIDTTSREDSGYSAVFGAGLAYRPARRLGLRLGWEYAKLKKESADIDTYVHNVRAIVTFDVTGR
jgi:hypothetical protein